VASSIVGTQNKQQRTHTTTTTLSDEKRTTARASVARRHATLILTPYPLCLCRRPESRTVPLILSFLCGKRRRRNKNKQQRPLLNETNEHKRGLPCRISIFDDGSTTRASQTKPLPLRVRPDFCVLPTFAALFSDSSVLSLKVDARMGAHAAVRRRLASRVRRTCRGGRRVAGRTRVCGRRRGARCV